MFVLGLQGSPRKGGNTDTFLSAFLDRAAQAGAAVKTIQAAKAGIVPCKGCGYCEKKGACVITDDPMAMEIYGLIRRADLVVAASPVYFYGISAQLKVLIDRCQTLWSRKYVLKVKDPLASERKGLLFSVAASRGRQLFDGIHLTAKYFFDAIDARMDHTITYRGIEAKGAIRKRENWTADVETAIEKTVLPLVARNRVLFLSAHGTCRAPMAAAMAQHRFADRIRTDYAGMEKTDALDETMVRCVQETGLDLGYRRPQSPEEAFFGSTPDLVVVIGDGFDKTPYPDVEHLHWPLPAPPSTDDQSIKALHFQIRANLEQLTKRIR
ncbi:NAD(P)H-dependent oxidoreductase [uncultured Desulfosarcina sp.]|uniref:NAD(P)H-dependent oxidoreductase n=1 Tax=uncultured Desulfosarcina sp. TaxID=218289 RepID=UPI0029C78AFA|nr:NAD(P)H-dependent oxidoreductase [uncultured Desulfosarcina sp.]